MKDILNVIKPKFLVFDNFFYKKADKINICLRTFTIRYNLKKKFYKRRSFIGY